MDKPIYFTNFGVAYCGDSLQLIQQLEDNSVDLVITSPPFALLRKIVNTVWWFSKSENPKADFGKVLAPYSDRMKKLIEDPDKFYTPKKRPSGHDISSNFGNDNGGAIPSNLIQISNSESSGRYLALCNKFGIKAHPARFPHKLPEFFVKMLTDEGDMVIDVFAGSCTTGEVCENLKRKWMCFELDRHYLAASSFRFIPKDIDDDCMKIIYDRICAGIAIEQKFNYITDADILGEHIEKLVEQTLFRAEDF